MDRTKLVWLVGICACFFCGEAWADWSPEIILWENQPNALSSVGPSCVAVDSFGNAHIVYSYDWYSNQIHGPAEALMYTKFDDHGNVLVPPIFLNDSLDFPTSNPRIFFFGTDSLWVVWGRSNWSPGGTNLQSKRCLDLDGHVLGPLTDWPDRPFGMISYYARVTVSPDRKAICAYTDTTLRTAIRVVVQNPDGSRPLNHTVVWNDHWEARLQYMFVDQTDSLQLGWNQIFLPLMSLVGLTKRIAVNVPFDTTQISDSALLTPRIPYQSWTVDQFLRSRDDSLLAYTTGGPGDSLFLSAYYLNVARRGDYSAVAQTRLDGNGGQVADFEPDGTISGWEYGPPLTREIWFRRFSYPALALIEDSLFMNFGDDGFVIQTYAVSAGGVRHVVYSRAYHSDTRIVYRYWRSDLGSNKPKVISPRPVFALWPNPVTESLTLEGPLSTVKSIVIYNILGQQVMTLALQSQAGQRLVFPQVSALPSGSYFLHLETLRGSSAQKIVINR